jgi:hypothetical protein
VSGRLYAKAARDALATAPTAKSKRLADIADFVVERY